MPFKSEAQRRYLWKNHPDIAQRWADEYPNQKDLPAKIKGNTTSEKKAMEQRDLYNLHVQASPLTKSAASLKGIMRAAEAPAFSRMDQVGIGIATGITTGQVNNLVHDAQTDRKELMKDKDEFRKEKLEDLQNTVSSLEKKLKEKRLLAEEAAKREKERDGDMRDSFSQPKPPTPASHMMPSNVPSSAYPNHSLEEKAAGLMDLFKVTDPAHPVFGYAHMDEVSKANSAFTGAAEALQNAASDLTALANRGGGNSIAAQKARVAARAAAAEAGHPSMVQQALDGLSAHGEGFAKMWVDASKAGPKSLEKELTAIEKAKKYLDIQQGTAAQAAAVKAQLDYAKAEKALEAAKVSARRAANIELASTVAPHGIGGLIELAKYPSWRRGALAETAAIKAKLIADARKAKLLRAAGIGAAGLGAAALIGGALYNRHHDPIEPTSPLMGGAPTFPSLSPVAGAPLMLEAGHASEEPQINWEEKSAASVWTLDDPHAVKPVGFLESMGGGKSVGRDIQSLPLWKKALGAAGLAGGGYLGHEAVKGMGGYGKAAETYFPYETDQVKSLMSYFSPRQAAEAPKKGGWKGLALGAAGVLGAGYLYNKMHPDETMEKQAEPKSASLFPEKVVLGAPAAGGAHHYQQLLAERAAEAMARKGNLKNLGIGLALGLAAPVVAKGISGIYNQVQQNRIQNQMLALQQMQMAQQMGMGMNYGYTQPVAIQQGMMM